MSSKENTESSKTPDSKNDDALSGALGQTLYDAYVGLVDTQGSSFRSLDTNANGYLNRIELVGGLGTEPTARQLLTGLPALEEQSNDELGDEDDGITNDDLENNLLSAIQAGGSPIKAISNDKYQVSGEIDAQTGEITDLTIRDEERDLTVSYSDSQLSIRRDSGAQTVDPDKFDAKMKEQLGEELFNAYQDYQDGGQAFDRIDYDENGTLDEKELNEFLILTQNSRDPSVQRQHEAANHMLRNMDEIKNAVDDEWIGAEDGITTSDLAQQLTNIATADGTWNTAEELLHDGADGVDIQNESAEGLYLKELNLSMVASSDRAQSEVTIRDPLRGVETTINNTGSIEIKPFDRSNW